MPHHDALITRVLEYITLIIFVVPTSMMYNILEKKYPTLDLKQYSETINNIAYRINTVVDFMEHVELRLQESNFDL